MQTRLSTPTARKKKKQNKTKQNKTKQNKTKHTEKCAKTENHLLAVSLVTKVKPNLIQILRECLFLTLIVTPSKFLHDS